MNIANGDSGILSGGKRRKVTELMSAHNRYERTANQSCGLLILHQSNADLLARTGHQIFKTKSPVSVIKRINRKDRIDIDCSNDLLIWLREDKLFVFVIIMLIVSADNKLTHAHRSLIVSFYKCFI